MRRLKNYSMILFVFVLASLLVTGCTQVPATKVDGPATLPPTIASEATEQVENQTAPALDPRSLKNLEYQLGIVKEAQQDNSGLIKLTDGMFEQALPNSSAKLQVDYVDSAVGDLNGDGVEDAIVLLAINTGGTGTFMQLAAVLNQYSQLKHVDTADLGDRTKIESIKIEDGKIKIQAVVHTVTDPQCCPSLEKLQEFVLQNDRLLPLVNK